MQKPSKPNSKTTPSNARQVIIRVFATIDDTILSNLTSWMWHHQTHHRYQFQEKILHNFSNEENDWNLFLKKMIDLIQAKKDQNHYEIKGKF